MRIYIASILGLVSLSGCGAAVMSNKIGTTGAEGGGVPYALPKTVLEAEVDIKEVPAGLYKVYLTAAGNEATTRPKVIAAIATLFGRKPDDIESEIKKGLPWEADPNPLDVARANDIKAKIEGAGGSVWLDPAPNEFRIDLTLVPQRVADWSRGYVIDTSRNPLTAFFSEDDWQIDVNTSGSLERISSTSSDKTGEVVVELAKAATLFFGGIPSPNIVLLEAKPREDKDPIKEFVQDTLRKLKGKHRVVVGDFSKLLPEGTQEFPIGPRQIAQVVIGVRRLDNVPASDVDVPEKGDGIFVTVDRPVELNATFQVNIGEWVPLAKIEQVAHLPDEAQIVAVPMRRAAFVTVTNTLDLDSGRVKQATGNIPSSALAVASIPVSIASAAMETIKNIFAFKLDIATKDADIRGKEVDFLTKQMDFLEKQHKLEIARASAVTAQERSQIDAALHIITQQIAILKMREELERARAPQD